MFQALWIQLSLSPKSDMLLYQLSVQLLDGNSLSGLAVLEVSF